MPAVVRFFDKVDEAEMLCCSIQDVLSAPPSRPALSSPLGVLTPHSAWSSNRARQWQLIRVELPSNGYPQPSGSSKNARQRHFIRAVRSSNGSCRSRRALEGSSLPSGFVLFFFLLRLATPALRLGVFGSWLRSESYLFLRRDGRRSGQPSSSSLARRACVHVLPFSSLVLQFTGTSIPGFRLLGHPDVRKRPWPLRRPRGDGHGGRFVRSPCLIRGAVCASTLYIRCCPFGLCFPLFPVQRWSIELPATTVGEWRRRYSL